MQDLNNEKLLHWWFSMGHSTRNAWDVSSVRVTQLNIDALWYVWVAVNLFKEGWMQVLDTVDSKGSTLGAMHILREPNSMTKRTATSQ